MSSGLLLDLYQVVVCSSALIHAWGGIWRLGPGMLTRRRKCWKRRLNGEQLLSLKKSAGYVGSIQWLPAHDTAVFRFKTILSRPFFLTYICPCNFSAWSSTWRRDRKNLQSKFSWSIWEDCSYNEARDAGLCCFFPPYLIFLALKQAYCDWSFCKLTFDLFFCNFL